MTAYLMDVWMFAQAPLGIGSLWVFVLMLRRVLDAVGDVIRSARRVMMEAYVLGLHARALIDSRPG
jgi:hypothetical protein